MESKQIDLATTQNPDLAALAKAMQKAGVALDALVVTNWSESTNAYADYSGWQLAGEAEIIARAEKFLSKFHNARRNWDFHRNGNGVVVTCRIPLGD